MENKLERNLYLLLISEIKTNDSQNKKVKSSCRAEVNSQSNWKEF